jgi:hypothetical protein
MNPRPLRRIVGYVQVEVLEHVVVVHELLECGHHQHPRHDHFGETDATRRRCRSCER